MRHETQIEGRLRFSPCATRLPAPTGHRAGARVGSGLLAATALVALLSGVSCSSRLPGADGPSLARLRVLVAEPGDLRACTHHVGNGAWVGIGPPAAAAIEAALDDTFDVVAPGDAIAVDLVAIPRITSVSVVEENTWTVRARIGYGVWFRTAAGEDVANVHAEGAGVREYPALFNLARALVHLGTLFLFRSVDADHSRSSVVEQVSEEAGAALQRAMATSNDLLSYARNLHASPIPISRDRQIDALLEGLVPRRSLAVAVLDLQPIDGSSTMEESYLAEELRTRLARLPGVRTFERALLSHALEELQLSMTDLVSPEHARRFGHLIAADAIVTGTTVRFPHGVKLTLRALDSESGRVIGAGSATLRTGQGFPTAPGRPARQLERGCPS